MRAPKAILFDHDGVLVASEPLHTEAWARLLGELGIPFVPAEIEAQVGRTAPETLTALLDLHRPGWSASDYDVEALAARKNVYYLDWAETRLAPNPGVREGLAWLRANGIRSAVVSNARRRELHGTLAQLGLVGLLDEVVSREDAGVAKPDPRPYLLAAECLGLDPAQCLAVEDSPTGLEAALSAGIPAAAVLTTTPAAALTQPVPGRPDLRPIWIGSGMEEFFAFVRSIS